MKIIFFGTPRFSGEILKYIVSQGIKVLAVVTQPDKQSGRNMHLQPPAVKQIVAEMGLSIPVIQPQKISSDDFIEKISAFNADCYVVVAFGQIFPTKLLQIPKYGCVNVHTSLLPKYRGAAPIERAIFEGETETGVSIMYMVKKLDAGDVLAAQKVAIKPKMNALELTLDLCSAAKDLLFKTLLKLEEGCIKAKPQDESKVTYAKKITPQDAEIFWNKNVKALFNQYRAVTPKPGAWCSIAIRGALKRLKIIKMEISSIRGLPGQILKYGNGEIVVGAKEGSLKILILQLEGKKKMSAEEFIKGYPQKEVTLKF